MTDAEAILAAHQDIVETLLERIEVLERRVADLEQERREN